MHVKRPMELHSIHFPEVRKTELGFKCLTTPVLMKVSATPSQTLKYLNAHTSWNLQTPKEKKRKNKKGEREKKG